MPFFRNSLSALLLAALLAAPTAFAGIGDDDDSTDISLDPADGAPANDLICPDKLVQTQECLTARISRTKAAELKAKGYDISTFDTVPSDNWTPNRIPISNASRFNYPADGAVLDFGQFIDAGRMYKAQVLHNGQIFHLVVDIDGHQQLAACALTRKLGYEMDSPQHYRNLTLHFAKQSDYDNFVSADKGHPTSLANQVGVAAENIIVAKNDAALTVTIRDANLESPRIGNVRYYSYRVMPNFVADNRAARALIAPMALANFALSLDSANGYDVEIAKVKADALHFEFWNANSFRYATIDDVRWGLRKLALLSRADFAEVLKESALPDDVQCLYLEKMMAGRRHLVEKAGLAKEFPELAAARGDYAYDLKRSCGTTVVNGELRQNRFDDHKENFRRQEDAQSPLRWKEMKHFVKITAISQVLKAFLNKANEELQVATVQDGMEAHGKSIQNLILDHLKNHPGESLVLPVKPWAKAIGGFNILGSRSVVTGSYYGSDSQIQLVDNVGIGGNIGVFGMLDDFGNPKSLQTIFNTGVIAQAGASYQYNITHVRPLGSLAAASKESWKNVWVPRYLGALQKILSPEIGTARQQLALAASMKAHREKRDAAELKLADDAVDGFQDHYADDAIFNDGYLEMKADGRMQLAWAKELAKVFPGGEKLANPQAIANYLDAERDLMIALSEQWNALDKLNAAMVVARMRQIEREKMPALLAAAGGDAAWKNIRAAEASFYAANGNFPDDSVQEALGKLFQEINDNEVITFTGVLGLRAGVALQVPLTALMGFTMPKKLVPTVGLSASGDWAIMHRLMMTRRNGNVEVYDSSLDTKTFTRGVSLTMWLKLATIEWQNKHGKGDTDAMFLDATCANGGGGVIDPSRDCKSERAKLLLSLRSLFRNRDADEAKRYYPIVNLRHDLKAKTESHGFLMWKWVNYQENLKAEVAIPPPIGSAPGSFDPQELTRTLYASRTVALHGRDPYGLFGQVVSKLAGMDFFDGNGDINPSNSFLGNAATSVVRTEAEITPWKKDYQPFVFIEENLSGWKKKAAGEKGSEEEGVDKKNKLIKALNGISKEVEAINGDIPVFAKDAFVHTKQIQLFNINSTTIIYPEGVRKFVQDLTDSKDKTELLGKLIDIMDPDDIRNRCSRYLREAGVSQDLEEDEKSDVALDVKSEEIDLQDKSQTVASLSGSKPWRKCVHRWIRKVRKLVFKKRVDPANREYYTQWLNNVFDLVNRNASPSRFLNKIGKENFLININVNGYRTGDENGDLEYFADQIGKNLTQADPLHPVLPPFQSFLVPTESLTGQTKDYWQMSGFILSGKFWGGP